MRLCEIESVIRERLEDSKSLTIAIDGMSCSGKTTLADSLASVFGATVIHMDDYFLPPGKIRTPHAGNTDINRFNSELYGKITEHRSFVSLAYDCRRGCYFPRVNRASGLVIVEGAYCLHPAVELEYDCKIFLTVSAGEQLRRLKARGNNVNDFLEKWIPLENDYFEFYDIKSVCDIVTEVVLT